MPLSSVRLRLDEIGYRGAELLDRLMAGEEKPARPILVSPGGVAERASTRTIPVRHPLLRRALGVMRERMGARLRTGEVAAICGVSRRRVGQLFVAELGRAPHAQLLRMRLQEAERRLRSEAMPVAEVAAACGFAGAGHPRAVFSRARGGAAELATGAARCSRRPRPASRRGSKRPSLREDSS